MKATNPDPVARLLELLPPLELLRIVPLAEAERLSSLSEDTLRREHGDKIKKLVRGAMACGHRRTHDERGAVQFLILFDELRAAAPPPSRLRAASTNSAQRAA